VPPDLKAVAAQLAVQGGDWDAYKAVKIAFQTVFLDCKPGLLANVMVQAKAGPVPSTTTAKKSLLIMCGSPCGTRRPRSKTAR